MGYDLVDWYGPSIRGRLSRHNEDRDREDDAAWEALTAELDAAVKAIASKAEYRRVLEDYNDLHPLP